MKLLHVDCLELMKDIPDKLVDMILCNLPYGMGEILFEHFAVKVEELEE